MIPEHVNLLFPHAEPNPTQTLVKCNLGSLLAHVDVLEERAVRVVGLLLDGGSKLEKVLRHLLVGALEDVDEPGDIVSIFPQRLGSVDLRSRVGLVVLGKERDGLALLAGAPGTADTVDVILNRQRELQRLVRMPSHHTTSDKKNIPSG